MYRVWCKMFVDGALLGTSVSAKQYKRKGYAERVARIKYGKPLAGATFVWQVSETNPFKEV